MMLGLARPSWARSFDQCFTGIFPSKFKIYISQNADAGGTGCVRVREGIEIRSHMLHAYHVHLTG